MLTAPIDATGGRRAIAGDGLVGLGQLTLFEPGGDLLMARQPLLVDPVGIRWTRRWELARLAKVRRVDGRSVAPGIEPVRQSAARAAGILAMDGTLTVMLWLMMMRRRRGGRLLGRLLSMGMMGFAGGGTVRVHRPARERRRRKGWTATTTATTTTTRSSSEDGQRARRTDADDEQRRAPSSDDRRRKERRGQRFVGVFFLFSLLASALIARTEAWLARRLRASEGGGPGPGRRGSTAGQGLKSTRRRTACSDLVGRAASGGRENGQVRRPGGGWPDEGRGPRERGTKRRTVPRSDGQIPRRARRKKMSGILLGPADNTRPELCRGRWVVFPATRRRVGQVR